MAFRDLQHVFAFRDCSNTFTVVKFAKIGWASSNCFSPLPNTFTYRAFRCWDVSLSTWLAWLVKDMCLNSSSNSFPWLFQIPLHLHNTVKNPSFHRRTAFRDFSIPLNFQTTMTINVFFPQYYLRDFVNTFAFPKITDTEHVTSSIRFS